MLKTDSLRRFLDAGDLTPEEARQHIRDFLLSHPEKSHLVYVLLSRVTWQLLICPYTVEIRDWHCLIQACFARLMGSDPRTAQRLRALGDLLGESITQEEMRRSLEKENS